MGNARNYNERSSTESITDAFLITPNDSSDLARFALGLRIWNPNGSASTIRIETVDGTDLTLTIPSSSLCIEPMHVARVYATNTSAGLVIHGYN